MATTARKLTSTGEWAKHLRPYGKRQANKAERKAAKVLVSKVRS